MAPEPKPPTAGPRRIQAVVIGGSAGAWTLVQELLGGLGPDYPVPIVLVLHVNPEAGELLAETLGLFTRLAVVEAEDKMPAETVAASLKVMEDFYDTRTLLATFYDAEAGDVYGVVYMFRAGETHSFGADKQPWSVVILRWQYDADEKKATLLNRVTLSTGRKAASADAPKVFADAKLLKYISAVRSAVSEKPSTP